MNEITTMDIDERAFTEEKVLKNYRKESGRFLETCRKLGELSPAAVQQVVEDLETEGKSVSTINKHISAMRKICRLAYNVRNLTPALQFEFENKLKEVKLQKVDATKKQITEDKVLTLFEYEKLRDAASPRMALVMEFLWCTGVRIAELCSVRLDKCEGVNGRYVITIKGKGKKEREIRISSDLYDRIYWMYHGQVYLFESSRTPGKMINERYMDQQIRKIADKIIKRKVGPHIFRHSFATRMLKENWSVKAVSQYLGHSSTAITMDMYMHDQLTDEALGIC